jgi:hypothetical protein
MISASQRPNVDTVNAASVITRHSSLATRRFKSSNSRLSAPVVIIVAVRQNSPIVCRFLPKPLEPTAAGVRHLRFSVQSSCQSRGIHRLSRRTSLLAVDDRRHTAFLLDMAARARTTYFVGTNIQATTVTKAAQLAA